MKRAINESKFTVIDTETTGFSPLCGDRICEIALLQVKNWQVINSYESFVNPLRAIPPQASAVSSITDDMVKDAPVFEEIAGQIRSIVSDSVLVFHNAPFDLAFIEAELKEAGAASLENEVIDTLTILRRAFRFPSNALSKVTDYLKIPHNNKHRAMSDARVTMELLKYIVKNLEAQTLSELFQYQ